jgi:hypothetical protein
VRGFYDDGDESLGSSASRSISWSDEYRVNVDSVG